MKSMTLAQSIVSKISGKQLLNHEFYQAWNDGSIPLETLRTYAQQYYHHVKAFPRYLSATHSNCDQIKARQFLLENLMDEENMTREGKGSEHHPELWLRFAEGLGTTRPEVEQAKRLPETDSLVNTFMSLCRSSYAEGLGALFTYEHQIPEIAAFKIEALKKHYSIEDSSTLSFFEVHKQADVYHTQTLTGLLEELSPEDKELATKASVVAADQLWKFLDGIHRQMSV